jgi:DNA end-binding protein Ku
MAKKLIDAMTTKWEPTKYKDQYQTAVMEMIEEKARKGSPSEKIKPLRTPSNVVDLVAVLQQSLQNTGSRQKQPPRASGARATSALVKQKRRSAAG